MSTDDLLSEIYASIDDAEEAQLERNWRRLSSQDSEDIRSMARAGSTVFDLFEYARRPKREVIAHMQQYHPSDLRMMLESTLRKSGRLS